MVEAAAIDLIGLAKLSNRVAGYHSSSFGRIGTRELIAMLRAKPVKLRLKAILITINQLYRSAMSAEELYEVTRGIWKIGPRREKAEYAMAVYQGIVLEVYRIKKWHHAGTLPYRTRDTKGFKYSGRWEFEGTPAQDIRAQCIDRSVGPGSQNPIRYVNI